MGFGNKILFTFSALLTFFVRNSYCGEIIYAINAGGEAHTDQDGVQYRRDPLEGVVGTASDFGRNLVIGRVATQDQALYQTERYHSESFSYPLPALADGRYVLVLLFSEVYFSQPQKKVFSVALGGVEVVSSLDIYSRVGRGVAHRELVPLSVGGGKVALPGGRALPLAPNSPLSLTFVKGPADNPKVNAFYLMRGSVADVAELPAMEEFDASETFSEETIPTPQAPPSEQVLSGPRTPSPYTGDAASFLPLLAAVGAAVPMIICLCRM